MNHWTTKMKKNLPSLSDDLSWYPRLSVVPLSVVAPQSSRLYLDNFPFQAGAQVVVDLLGDQR